MTRHVLAAAARMQLAETRRQPKHLLILLTNPLFAAIFLSITKNAGNPIAINAAVFAPALISMWFLSLDIGGDMISLERWQGTLDLLIASPARLGVVMFGRVCSVSLLVAATFAESYLVARFGFAVPIRLWHAWLLLVTIVLTLFAMSGTATLLAGLFVLSRQVLLFQNALTYPFYILGGVMVPVALLPAWLTPLSRVVFLSWSADLIRACLEPAAVAGWWWKLAIVALLGMAALAGGVVMIERVTDRVRKTGSATLA